MKNILKLMAVFTIVTCGVFTSNAQEVGIRVGDVSGGNVAIDAVFSTAEFSRVHADISFGDGVAIDVLWDFLYRPLIEDELNWYVGVGPYLSTDGDFELGGAGEIGLEYNFGAVPITLGVDWRPSLSIVEETDLHFNGFGVNLRYVF